MLLQEGEFCSMELFGFGSRTCSGHSATNTPVLMCSFLCVWCIPSCELLMGKSFFFSSFSVYTKLKSRFIFFFFPHRFLRSVKSNVKKGQYPFVTSLLGSGRCSWGVRALCHISRGAAAGQRCREMIFLVTCPHRGVCPFGFFSFQVWAGRCLHWELGRNPCLASHARALWSLEGWKVSSFCLSQGDTVSWSSELCVEGGWY